MKVLFTLNSFPFDAIAGDRLYAYHVAASMARKGVKTAICYRGVDPDRPDHSFSEKEFEGIPLFELNHLHPGGPNIEIENIHDGEIGATFGKIIDKFKPNAIHYNHSGAALGIGIIDSARQTGIPSVMTLHNYGAICPHGTMLKPDGSLCPGPTTGAECAPCRRMPSAAPAIGFRDRLRLHGPNLLRDMTPRGAMYLAGKAIKRAGSMMPRSGDSDRSSIPESVMEAYRLRREAWFEALTRKVDLLISPSEFLRRMYIQCGLPEGKIETISNGIEYSLFQGMEKSLSQDVRFAFIGRVVWEKGVHVLVEAFNKLEGLAATLDIYGQTRGDIRTREFSHYLEGINRNPRLRFQGPFDNRKIAKILENVDVLVVPSIWYENQPLTIQEALLAGIPVITSNIGGMAETVVDEVTGLHFKRGDPADLARKIKRFIDDRDIVARLGSSGRAPVNMDEHTDILIGKYERIIKEQSS